MSLTDNNQVAVFIDYENIELSCRDRLGAEFEVDWSQVLEAAVDFGRVVIRRAYGDWSLYRSSQRELLGLGVELVHVASKRGKNAADIRIVIDAMEMLIGERTNISHVLLVSGDGDFTELVHRMRGHGKIVVGIGISGASAEYLINACDQFIFYDILVGSRPLAAQQSRTGETGSAVSDISEARQLLRRALRSRESEWISAGQIKLAMLRLNPAFNEHNYGYESFKDFLAAQTDIVRLRTAQPGGHLEGQMVPEDFVSFPAHAPEALLETYLDLLAQQRIRMTPTENRPTIVRKLFDVYQEHPHSSLIELKEHLHNYFDEAAPNIKWQHVHETVHQLFHTYCFVFDQDDSKYEPDTRLWNRQVALASDIQSGDDLLDKSDQGLLLRIGRRLGAIEDVDREIAARILYGRTAGPDLVQHVDDLIAELNRKQGKSNH